MQRAFFFFSANDFILLVFSGDWEIRSELFLPVSFNSDGKSLLFRYQILQPVLSVSGCGRETHSEAPVGLSPFLRCLAEQVHSLTKKENHRKDNRIGVTLDKT